MKPKLVLLAIAGAGTFIIGTHYFSGEYLPEVFALFLALTACVYGGASLVPAAAKYGQIELPFVIIVFLSSILGIVYSVTWIALGYFLHGLWDLLHHFKKIKTPILRWFPPICAIFDFVVGAFILLWWLNSR